MMYWLTSRRKIFFNKTLVMAILNVTPDSFSDGGEFFSTEKALRHAEKLIAEGADILDVGGESTRPHSERVSAEEEIKRVCPIIEAIAKRFNVPVSVDTSKAEVAERAVGAGAEVINDVSGLRFDEKIAEVASKYKTGLILMHLRGTFETMHRQAAVSDILREVSEGFRQSVEKAKSFGINENQIVLDVGLGFGKTFEQNLELIGKLKRVIEEFPDFPLLVGASRKSFIGKILDDAPVENRLAGTLAANSIAAWNGANIVRVHDVRETIETLKVVDFIKKQL
ncbi:MAG TPA: dihydropteroate synthase [Pyrinomonadaceae bacterium]|jgi:dihydropteroate synthase